jgi:hypothetical protein
MTRMAYPYQKTKKMLREMLDQYRGETTEGKLVLIARLREYVRRQDPYVVKDEISVIDDETDLNILVGVGLRGILWYEVVKQKARCTSQ